MIKIKKYNIILLLIFVIGCQSSSSRKSINVENSISDTQENDNQPNAEGLRYFMNGQLLMNQGDFAMAIIEFQQALNLDPNVGEIHLAIAECYWNIGKLELSKNHLE